MTRLALLTALALSTTTLAAIGYVDFDGTELGLVSYTNSTYTYSGPGLGTNASFVAPGTATTSWVAGDSFWPLNRGNVGPNNVGMPFNISDDSVAGAAGNTTFAADVLGFAGQWLDNGFFGVTDTENPVNSGFINADFVFDISGYSNLSISLDMIAMGDFELADQFIFAYHIDGGPFTVLWSITADEAASLNYTMDSGAVVTLDDPLVVGSTYLTDFFQTFTANIAGTGSLLTIRFAAVTDGNEGFGFDNLRIVPEPSSLGLLALGGLALIRRR